MLIQIYPFIDEDGNVHNDLIKTCSTDPKKGIRKIETGEIFDSAVDIYPCLFTYEEVELESEDQENEEGENN